MAQFYPPLKERIVRSKCTTFATIDTSSASVSRGTYKEWNEDSMIRAVDAVLNKGLSIRRAAELYSIPKSTLSDRISGRVLMGSVSGPAKYLTTQQEEELVYFLLECASIGYPKSRQQVIAMVQQLINERGIQRIVTHGWWESFCHRHTNVTLRTTAPLSLSRAKASDVGVMNKYFDMLQSTINEYDLTDKPCQWFNMDETGMPLSPKPLKMVASLGSKNPVSISAGTKAQVTIVGCVNAAGYCIPPMVIYGGRKTLSAALVENEIPGTIYGLSPKGWIDQDLFDQWFDHFLCYTPSNRPLLLLIDGHSSHYCPRTIHYASEKQVILFALPPNTTHITQPLDKGVYGPLKVEWRKVCHEYITSNPGKVVTMHSFSSLFAKAWMQSMTIKNIMAGFHTTGIYPLDRSKVISALEESVITPPHKTSSLTYLPLLTPLPSPRKCKVATVFSNAEIKLYLERYERGYEGNDERYKAWLGMYHPESVKCDDTACAAASLNESVFHTPKYTKKPSIAPREPGSAVAIAKISGKIEKLFDHPVPPSTLPTKREKESSRVLTSGEALKQLQEKEAKKEAVKQRKEQQQKKKEEKALAKLNCAKQKQQVYMKQDEKQQKQKEHTEKVLNNRNTNENKDNDLVSKQHPVEEFNKDFPMTRSRTRTDMVKRCIDEAKKEECIDLGSGSPSCIITKVCEGPLSRSEIQQQKLESRKKQAKVCYKQPSLKDIESGRWLNDTHINAVNYLLKAQFPSALGLYDPRYGEDLSFSTTETPFVQILHAENHWLTVEGVNSSLVNVYDTKKYATTEIVQSQIAAIIHCKNKFITLQFQPTQRQKGDSDCGLFAIAYATDLCYGNKVSTLQYYQERLRMHLIKCLNAKRMTPFPSKKSCRLGKSEILNIDVFCYCRLPDNGDEKMAACDSCHEWYHHSCARIPDEVFIEKEIMWQCKRCS